MMDNVRECDLWVQALSTGYYGKDDMKLDRAFWDDMLGHVSVTNDALANMFDK